MSFELDNLMRQYGVSSPALPTFQPRQAVMPEPYVPSQPAQPSLGVNPMTLPLMMFPAFKNNKAMLPLLSKMKAPTSGPLGGLMNLLRNRGILPSNTGVAQTPAADTGREAYDAKIAEYNRIMAENAAGQASYQQALAQRPARMPQYQQAQFRTSPLTQLTQNEAQ